MPNLVFTPPASTSASAPTASNVSPTEPLVSQTSAGSSQKPVGAIVGGVVGGLLALVLIPLIVFWLRRRMAKENLNLTSEEKLESVSLVHLSAFFKELYSLGSGS